MKRGERLHRVEELPLGGGQPAPSSSTRAERECKCPEALEKDRQRIASLRCVAVREDGRRAEPVGKDWTAFKTIASRITGEGGAGSEGRNGGGFCGCLANISSTTSWEGLINPSDSKSFSALPNCPSAMTRLTFKM